MLTLDQAKKLKSGDQLEVTNTHEVWEVDRVEIKGVLPFLYVKQGERASTIPPERMHLFTIIPAQNVAKPAKVEDTAGIAFEELRENLTDALTQTVQTTTVDLTVEEAKHIVDLTVEEAKHIAERIEHYLTEEPELTKPARKSRKVKKEA